MGIKGDKKTSESSLTAALLVEKLQSIEGVTSKSMFGGYGIFHNGGMFGMVDSKGQAFLKVNETNRATFEKANSQPHGKMPYLTIPDSVMKDQNTLVAWAKTSIAINK